MAKISPRRLDFVLALIIFVFSSSIGVLYVATYEPVPYFLQHMFGPAVMWACGRGFENPKLSETPQLEDFLYWRRTCFDCAKLPKDLPVVPADPFSLTDEQWREYHPHPEFAGWVNCQQFHKYMLMSAAILWRVLGVSWRALLPLYGLLYGMAGAAVYGLFRLAMKRPLAFVMAMLFIVAPLQLQQLPDLRDYAKAPFFISAIYIMGMLAAYPLSKRQAFIISALCGTILGIGAGFRQDVLISVPAFALTALVFLPGKIQETVKLRLGVLSLFLIAFLFIGGPILRVLFTQANNSSHDTLIGFTKYCDDRLGVGSALYDFGDPFLDEYTRATVESYEYRIHGRTGRLRHYTSQYDQASAEYFRTLATTFPADLVTRAYASILRVLDELRPSESAPRGIANPGLQALYKFYNIVMMPLLAYGRYAAALALILIAGRNLRLGFFALFILCWFAGYPSLRFSVRHAFHLQFISYFIAGMLIQQGIALVRKMAKREIAWKQLQETAPPYCKRAAAFVAIAGVALALPLVMLRAYQQRNVDALLQAYLDAPRQPLKFNINGKSRDSNQFLPKHLEEATLRGAGQKLVTVPTFSEGNGHAKINSNCPHLIMMRVRLPARPAGQQIRVLYDGADPMWDFSRIVQLDRGLHGGVDRDVQVFIPIYTNSRAEFRGFEVSGGVRTEDVRMYQLDEPFQCPILLTAILPDDWQKYPRYYQLSR